MNLKLLRGCLLEELGRAWHLTSRLKEILPQADGAIRVSGRLEGFVAEETRQQRVLKNLFTRFQAAIPEQAGPAITGLLAEMREELHRESAMYPPAAMDFRLLSGLNRIVHQKLSTLRSAIVAAHLLDAREVEEALQKCLEADEETSRDLVSLAAGLLHQCSAESAVEMASAPIHFD